MSKRPTYDHTLFQRNNGKTKKGKTTNTFHWLDYATVHRNFINRAKKQFRHDVDGLALKKALEKSVRVSYPSKTPIERASLCKRLQEARGTIIDTYKWCAPGWTHLKQSCPCPRTWTKIFKKLVVHIEHLKAVATDCRSIQPTDLLIAPWALPESKRIFQNTPFQIILTPIQAFHFQCLAPWTKEDRCLATLVGVLCHHTEYTWSATPKQVLERFQLLEKKTKKEVLNLEYRDMEDWLRPGGVPSTVVLYDDNAQRWYLSEWHSMLTRILEICRDYLQQGSQMMVPSSYNKYDPCPICHETMVRPKEHACGHSFCRRCIDKWTQTGSEQCPLCRCFLEEYDGQTRMDLLREVMADSPNTLHPLQERASNLALQQRLAFVTGPGGTGKTELIIHVAKVEAKLALLVPERKRFIYNVCLAPSGKAVTNMKQRLEDNLSEDEMRSFRFKTIHSWVRNNLMEREGAHRIPEAPDTVFVDEASMLSPLMTYYLLSTAVRRGVQRLVFLGDPLQLSPVKATGSLLTAFRNSPYNVELTENYRSNRDLQAVFGLLRDDQHTLKDVPTSENVHVVSVRVNKEDRIHWTQDGDVTKRNKKDRVLARLLDACITRVQSLTREERKRTRIISPNRDLLFHDDKKKAESFQKHQQLARLFNDKRQVGSNEKWVLGDLVLCKTNYYDHNDVLCVCNGSEGTIKNITWEQKGGKSVLTHIQIQFGTYLYEYTPADLDIAAFDRHAKVMHSLELGTVRTVHTYQGSESDIVICLFRRVYFASFATRELLYTAASRAKRKLYLIFDEHEYNRYCKGARHQKTYDDLNTRIKQLCME